MASEAGATAPGMPRTSLSPQLPGGSRTSGPRRRMVGSTLLLSLPGNFGCRERAAVRAIAGEVSSRVELPPCPRAGSPNITRGLAYARTDHPEDVPPRDEGKKAQPERRRRDEPSHSNTLFFSAPLAPNARPELLLEVGARHEQMPEAVSSRPLFGAGWTLAFTQRGGRCTTRATRRSLAVFP